MIAEGARGGLLAEQKTDIILIDGIVWHCYLMYVSMCSLCCSYDGVYIKANNSKISRLIEEP